jgi:amidase
MKLIVSRIAVLLCLFPAFSCLAQSGGKDLSGKWEVTLDFKGTILYRTLNLRESQGALTGTFANDELTGSHVGTTVKFVAKGKGSSTSIAGQAAGEIVKGEVTLKDSEADLTPLVLPFTAVRVPPRSSGPPRHHEFTPTVFYRQFSAFNKPVLHIAPGDVVHTTTVDAGGRDEHGESRSAGGNPQTGPFYIDGTLPGDTLVVHILKLRLNRDWAVSDDALVGRALDSDLAVMMKDTGKTVRWHLDRERGVAYPERRSGHLARYEIPLRPMLGGLAVAPNPAGAAPGTGDSGNWGGNMDFNEIGEGTTVYLPVSNPGALLYLGDGHAAQGDGELNGNALETSMDVEFSVDVISGKQVPTTHLETATHIAAMGFDGSLDGALKDATSSMSDWLKQEYKLTPSEIAQVIGSSAEYRIGEIADRNAGVVLKLDKRRVSLLVK